MKPLEDRIATKKEQAAKLAARIRKDEARLKEAERKREMRRKILVGDAVLDAIGGDEDLKGRINALLQARLKGEDLKLFGL